MHLRLSSVTAREGFSLRIEGPFTCTLGREEHRLDPEKDPAGLGPVLKLLHLAAVKGRVSGHGDIDLEFSTGSIVKARHGEQYEAWTLNADGLLIVSGPGGRVSIFRPKQERSGRAGPAR